MFNERVELYPPRLVVFTATPGVGKTVAIQHVERSIACQVISKDDVASYWTNSRGNDYIQIYRPIIYGQLYQLIDHLLSSGTVLVEATHSLEIKTPGWETRYREIANTHGAQLKIIRFVTTEDILMQRMIDRGSPLDIDKLATEEDWARFMREQPIHVNTIPTDCGLIIDNSGPLSDTVNQTLAFIQR